MNFFDWLDKHWFVGGWCCVTTCAGFAAILHGIGKRIAGRATAQSGTSDGEKR